MLKFKRVAAAAAITLALPASAAAQEYQDLRGERARDAALQPELRTQDLRMPDRRVPDTGVRVPPVQPAPAEVRVVEVATDGFDWGDAGIGAAGGLAILSLAGGMVLIATHRRRGPAVG
jgi:hypothetical protein